MKKNETLIKWRYFLLFYLLHLGITVFLFWVAHTESLSNLHNGRGFWNITIDASDCHGEAIGLMRMLESGDYIGWWKGSKTWHTKWIALVYYLTIPNPLSFAPVNSLLWTLSLIFIYKIMLVMWPERQTFALTASLIFSFWPSYLFHSTQLLKYSFLTVGILLAIMGWMNLFYGNGSYKQSVIIGLGVLLAVLNRLALMDVFLFISGVSVILIIWHAKKNWRQAVLAMCIVMALNYSNKNLGIQAIFEDEYEPKQTTMTENKHNNKGVENGNNKNEKLGKETMDPTSKKKAPVVLFQPTYKVEKSPSPSVAETPSPSVAETPSPSVAETSSPSVAKTPSPSVAETIDKEKPIAQETNMNKTMKKNSIKKKSKKVKEEPAQQMNRFIVWLDSKLYVIAHKRADFLGFSGAGSNIDEDINFRNSGAMISYLPKAFLIGFFAPFPRHWFEEGKNAGWQSRRIAGLEMLLWYFLMAGFIIFLKSGNVHWRIKLWLCIFSFCTVVVTSLVVANLGALFRMRHIYLTPILIGGLDGLARFRMPLFIQSFVKKHGIFKNKVN